MKTINISNLTPVVLELTHEHKVKYHLHYPVTTLVDAVNRVEYFLSQYSHNRPTKADSEEYVQNEYDLDLIPSEEYYNECVEDHFNEATLNWIEDVQDLADFKLLLTHNIPMDSDKANWHFAYLNISTSLI